MLKRILSVFIITCLFLSSSLAAGYSEIAGFSQSDGENNVGALVQNMSNALTNAGFYFYGVYHGTEDLNSSFEDIIQKSKDNFELGLESATKYGQTVEGEGKLPKVLVVFSAFHNQSHIEVYNTDKQYLSDEDIAAIKSCYDDTSLTAEERIENGDAALFSRLTKGMELTDNAEGEALIEKYKAIDPDFFAEKGGNTVIYIAAAAVIIVIAVFVMVRKSKKTA